MSFFLYFGLSFAIPDAVRANIPSSIRFLFFCQKTQIQEHKDIILRVLSKDVLL